MQIKSIPDSNTNFSLVFLKDTGKYIKNLTPHCNLKFTNENIQIN